MRHALLDLDFMPRRPPWAEYAVLATAVLVASAVVFAGIRARSDVHSAAARLEQRSVQQHLRAGAAQAAGQPALPADVARALATPWSKLLSDLESQAVRSGSNVALLRIEPDRVHGSLLLVAEARTLPSALQYVQQLQKLPSLSRAVLQSHEILKDEPEKA